MRLCSVLPYCWEASRLRSHRRCHLSAEHSFDCGDTWHAVCLARIGDPDLAQTGRETASLVTRFDEFPCALRPFPIVAAMVIAALVHVGLMRTSYGAILRGSGGNPSAIGRAGWSLLKTKIVMFALAGVFGVFSGLALIGLTTSADANIGKGYTLLSIAGVILGGGEFVGGRVSPIGAVIGALTLTLAGSLLNFMRISPDWQVGAQGGILIIVLAARAMINQHRPENVMKLVGRVEPSGQAMDLVLPWRLSGLVGGHRFHPRLRRRRDDYRCPCSCGLFRDCGCRADVRDHARTGQR